MKHEQFTIHAAMEQKHWWFLARRQIMKALLSELLPPSPAATVVDVGCGTGGNIASLADSYRCIGIDQSQDAIKLARERFRAVDFVCSDTLDDLPVELQEVDLFLLMDVMEHVRDDFELLSQLLTESRDGTLILLTVPADMALWSPHDVAHGHYRRYDVPRLVATWTGLPVEPLLISYFNNRLYPLVRLARMLARLRGSSIGRSGTDLVLPFQFLNRMLKRIFAGEQRRLVKALHNRGESGYHCGVSLIAVLQRQSGGMNVRQRPAELVGFDVQP